MAKSRRYDLKSYGTTWEDLIPWVEQLYAEHGLRVRLTVSLEPGQYELPPTCIVELYRTLPGGRTEEAWRDYKTLRLRVPNMAESLFLQMLSKALLELDNERYAAERQQPLWAS